MADDKDKLRLIIKQKIARLGPLKRHRKSKGIGEKLLSGSAFNASKRIFCYASFGGEVSTKGFIIAALSRGKEIYAPRINRKTGRMEIYLLHNLSKDLVAGTYRISEPRPVASRKGKIEDMDLIIVPGMAFTKMGARLGRGGGHFDRLLARTRGIRKIGLAYREQILPKIPMERHDIFMDQVITD